MSVDKDELLKEIERCEYEKPRLVVWTQMDEFRLQCMKDLAAANATIERLSAPKDKHQWQPSSWYPGYEQRIDEEGHLLTRPIEQEQK